MSLDISSVLDVPALDELYELLEKDLDGIIYLFKTNSSEQLASIKKAAARVQMEALVREVHSLKGSCRNIGAIKMAEKVEVLELFLKDFQASSENSAVLKHKMEAELTELNALHAEALIHLEQYLQTKG